MNFITNKLYLTKLIRERDRAGRKGEDKLPGETNAKGLEDTVGKKTCHPGMEWEEWGCPHDVLPRARLYSMDQPGISTSENTLYFIRNCIETNKSKSILLPMEEKSIRKLKTKKLNYLLR